MGYPPFSFLIVPSLLLPLVSLPSLFLTVPGGIPRISSIQVVQNASCPLFLSTQYYTNPDIEATQSYLPQVTWCESYYSPSQLSIAHVNDNIGRSRRSEKEQNSELFNLPAETPTRSPNAPGRRGCSCPGAPRRETGPAGFPLSSKHLGVSTCPFPYSAGRHNAKPGTPQWDVLTSVTPASSGRMFWKTRPSGR